MTNFVIDFETLGTESNCVVLSCAVTFFDDTIQTFDEYCNQTHYWKFEVEEQITKYNRTIEKGVVDFWEKQDKKLRDSQIEPNVNDVSIKDFIFELDEHLKSYGFDKNRIAFCRGQSFDFPILSNIVKSVNKLNNTNFNPIFFPVAFWNQRDIRSYISGLLCDVHRTKCPLPEGVLDGFELHNPIHDNARAILMIQYAEAYASGDIEVPDESNWDPNSL